MKNDIRTFPPILSSQTVDGTAIWFDASLSFTAKITSGSQPYEWVEVVPATGGGNSVKDGGRSGTISVHPAYELNGVTTVSAGTVVDMVEWWFDTAGTTQLNYGFTVSVAATPGSLTVENEVDSQEVDNVSTLVISKKRRYTISSPGAGIAKVELDIFWAQITGYSSGSNTYSWQEMTETDLGTFAVLGGGRSGTTTVNAAYECNGNNGVSTNEIVRMWRGYPSMVDGPNEYLFFFPQAASGLTVENADATQVVTGVETLIFAKKRRWTISSPAGTQAQAELDIFWAKITGRASQQVLRTTGALAGATTVSLSTSVGASIASGTTLRFYGDGMTDAVLATLTGPASGGATSLSVSALSGNILNNAQAYNPPQEAYSWVEMTETDLGTFAVLGGGRSGTTTVNAAYEANANNQVPTNAIVEMWRGFPSGVDGPNEYLFEFQGALNAIIPIPPPPAPLNLFYAQIDDYEPGSHLYKWHEVIPVGPGLGARAEGASQFQFVTKPVGRSGDFNTGDNPGWEINDNPRTPDYSIVVMSPAVADPITGSGCTVDLSVTAGAITSVTLNAGGTGYPASSTFYLVPVQGGGSGAVLIASTDGSGVVTTISLISVSGGTGYTAASDVDTSGMGTTYCFVGDTTPFFAQITGQGSGGPKGYYSFVELDAHDSAPFNLSTFGTRPNGKTGSTSVRSAYEVNGSSNVPNGAVVIMWWGYFSSTDSQEFQFYYAIEPLSVRTTANAQGPFHNVNLITLDPNTNWTITNPTTGEVKIDTAGWTGTFTGTVITAVSCTAGTLSVTSKVLTLVGSNGLITTAPTLV